MWIVVGILTIEMVTLAFPILQIFKHKWFTRSTRQVLAAFDAKQLTSTSTENGSMATRSTGSKGGRMYSMESLEECLNTDHDGLQLYASCMELNGENIIFLVKVANFRQNWATTFSKIHNYGRARMSMFRAGLSIYVSLVHSSTASYPINIESPIYARLHSIFGAATELVASRKSIESPTTPISAVTPWDEPPNLDDVPPVGNVLDANEMYAMRSMTLSIPPTRRSLRNESSEHIIPLDDLGDAHDALASFQIPREFDERVFDAAYKSIKYMVWTETWQRYMTMKRGSGSTV